MKILLIIDQYDSGNNGTTMSAQRLAHTLMAHGHQVRVVSTGAEKDGKYRVAEYYLTPLVRSLVHKEGMTFGKPDDSLLARAISWADVAHLMLPFSLARHGLKIARELEVPVTAAFHVQPENITYAIGLGHRRAVNDWLYDVQRRRFYDQIRHIHVPSAFMADQLRQHGYTNAIHVISNGVDPDFHWRKAPKDPAFRGKFVILMIGRYANEKRQDVLIDAIRRSPYQGMIQLVLAGKGPEARRLHRLGRRLYNPPVFRFYSHDDLLDLLAQCDLYVHASDAESEAISCIEAFSCGLVPVIADSPLSATPQFARDPRSLFAAGNSRDLCGHITYWMTHPGERRAMEKVYADYGATFNLDTCVRQMEALFEEAIADAQKPSDC